MQTVGKQVAGSLVLAEWSSSRTCFLKPCGPSVIMMDGMPSLSMGFVCQESKPEHRLAFSSSVIWDIRAFISLFM
jgi:hypothetical protein